MNDADNLAAKDADMDAAAQDEAGASVNQLDLKTMPTFKDRVMVPVEEPEPVEWPLRVKYSDIPAQ